MSHNAPDEGGILLIAVNATPETITAALAILRQKYDHISVLITPDQKAYIEPTDEIWLLHRLGLRGIFALIRRIVWRRFYKVYQLEPSFALTLLRLATIPKPEWTFSI